MPTSTSKLNPYAAPISTGNAREPDWYLFSACRYFKGIGYVSLAYIVFYVTPMLLYLTLTDESCPLGVKIGVLFMLLGMSIFCMAMIRTAKQLPLDFERHYRRARWLGILSGAFGFPLLSIPAFIGVSRLSRYRTLISCDGTNQPDKTNP